MRGVLAALLLLAACKPTEPPPGLGRPVATGLARGLKPSPDGNWLAYLHDCERSRDKKVPEDVFGCDLSIVAAQGGAPRKVARGVTSLDVGFMWSPDGSGVAVLEGYDYATHAGTLVWAPREGEPRKLGEKVPFYAFDAGGTLGFVSAGQLKLAVKGGEPVVVAGATDVATFEFAPGGQNLLLARRRAMAGGQLLLVSIAPGAGAPQRIADMVAEYAFSPDGRGIAFSARQGQSHQQTLRLHLAAVTHGSAGTPKSLGDEVQSFSFGRSGGSIAFLASMSRDRTMGELHVAAGGPARKWAEKVGDYRWATAAPKIAWLEQFNSQTRSGTLMAAAVGGKPVKLGKHVSAFALAADGNAVAFLEHVTGGTFSVDLRLAAGDAEPVTVAKGVFGFDFTPDGKHLFYRTNCVRNAEACDLFKVAVPPVAGKEPEKLAEQIKSFEFAEPTGSRALITWSRRDMMALDVAILEGQRTISVDNFALPGSASFLGPAKDRLGYVVVHRKRPGVYVAQLPAVGATAAKGQAP
jgi:hypothetical protein